MNPPYKFKTSKLWSTENAYDPEKVFKTAAQHKTYTKNY